MSTPTAGDGGGESVSAVPPTASSGEPVGGDGTIPVLAGAAASSTTVAVGAGSGKRKKTSNVWQHFVQFSPPDLEGRNVKCLVERVLPASGLLPERKSVCGQRFMHRTADKKKNISGTGTSGLSSHLEREHPVLWATMTEGRGSKAAKAEKGAILHGEVPVGWFCLHQSCPVCCVALVLFEKKKHHRRRPFFFAEKKRRIR